MRKYLIVSLMLIVAIMVSLPVYAQSAKEAVMALKKMEARVQSGVSYKDYGQVLGEAKFPVNLYLESKDAGKNKVLSESIARAMLHYDNAGIYWRFKFSSWQYGIDKDSEKSIIAAYPDADKDAYHDGARTDRDKHMLVDFLLPVVWRAASKELKHATESFSLETTKETDEVDKLKQEIARLKKENEDLRKRLKRK